MIAFGLRGGVDVYAPSIYIVVKVVVPTEPDDTATVRL